MAPETQNTTLLRDLISIPEEVHKGDFVMSLAKGVAQPDATLEDYVVTDQLTLAYDNALGFIASVVRDDRSKAAYLDGSFGSGKSHFMAVLHLLLQRHPDARAIPELADVIAKHDPVLGHRSFDLVPVHMIGAETLEQRIFEGYLAHLDRVAPGSPPPGIFADAPLFEQADLIRAERGDERFFAKLNEASDPDDEGWGELAATWNADSYDRARTANLGEPERHRLAGELIATHVPMFREAFRGTSTGFVEVDIGLAELARHASARQHDALVLFLDELILWLGSRMQDQAFVQREGPKLVKLIEYTTSRPIPIVAFVARQRDLREFLGESVPGAEKLSFLDTLKHFNDRFHRVELHDRNLPQIARKRLLEPASEAARQRLDEACREVERARPEVLNVLLTDEADRGMFRATYPFSPAFMKTLVAASSALQRERTALRVMLQLLVERRHELTVGDLVSVGDLFDVLAHGDEPFTDDMRRAFEQAKALYRDQLRPILLVEHKLSASPAEGLPRDHPFRADDRLVKTLLLAALVTAEPLRNLDVARLTALNHGSIRTPIAGAEKTLVLQKLKRWRVQVPQLRMGDDPHNPPVSVRLTGVDVDSILQKAESVDNAGVRRQLVKRLVFEELGIAGDGSLLPDEYRVLWRGTWRTVDLLFGNIRDEGELPSDVLRASGDRWKVVIDYPFDRGHTPAEDLDRLDRWRAEHGSSQTACWIPAFFSEQLQRDLKRLVIVDHVLEGERLDQYADHLSRQERQQASGILSDMHSGLREHVRTAIRQAYGVERVAPDTIDTSHEVEDRLQSLTAALTPQVPIGARLEDAFRGLVRQMHDAQYPDHPRFEEEVKPRDLRIVWEEVQRAADHPDGRIEHVASDRRKVLRRIANPLELGIQHEAPFVLTDTWKDRLNAAVAREGQESITVGDLRRWIDEPRPRGLTSEVSALIVLTYATQTGRTFRLRGGSPGPIRVDRLEDDLELVTAELPTEEAWRAVVERAPALFGLGSLNPARNPNSVDALATSIRERAATLRVPAERLSALVEGRLRELGPEAEGTARLKSARAAAAVAATLDADPNGQELVERIAAVEIPTSAQAVGASLTRAEALAAALDDDRWKVLDVVAARARAGQDAHCRVIEGLLDALQRDEFAEPLEPAIARAYDEGVRLLDPTEPPPPPSPGGGRATGLSLEAARAKLDELAWSEGDLSIDLQWTIKRP